MKKKKRGASSEPTRGWLAPGCNYWLLLAGACRAESSATPGPTPCSDFWPGSGSPHPLEGWSDLQLDPQYSGCPRGSRKLQLPPVELCCCSHSCERMLQSTARISTGQGQQSPSPLPILCQEQLFSPQWTRVKGVMKKQDQGCRGGSCSVECHPFRLKLRQGVE